MSAPKVIPEGSGFAGAGSAGGGECGVTRCEVSQPEELPLANDQRRSGPTVRAVGALAEAPFVACLAQWVCWHREARGLRPRSVRTFLTPSRQAPPSLTVDIKITMR